VKLSNGLSQRKPSIPVVRIVAGLAAFVVLVIGAFVAYPFTSANQVALASTPGVSSTRQTKKKTLYLPPLGHTKIAGENLLFDNEFNGSSLNTTQWNIEDFGQGGYRNSSSSYALQYYTPKALAVQNGALSIMSDQQSMGGRNYTSGALTTEHTFNFLYGRVDIRARLPKGQGIWPAFWMLTANADHEIDIMEMINTPKTVYQTYHVHTPIVNAYVSQGIVKGQDFSAAYHTYSLVWTSTSIKWYIDGVQTFQVTGSVPHTPMYLLLNTAIGGQWPGPPNASTPFPQSMTIDYVRVYH